MVSRCRFLRLGCGFDLSSTESMNIVILAAGMGKRMHSRLPKVLQPLAGRPMLDHVLEAVKGLSDQPAVVVVGHCAEEVQSRYAGRDDLAFALQVPQKGTGHALMQAGSEQGRSADARLSRRRSPSFARYAP